VLNEIYNKSCTNMDEIETSSIHLMITSPPYNVGKSYEIERTRDEYREFILEVMTEVKRVLVPGGRACINVSGTGRKPWTSLNTDVTNIMGNLGFLNRGEIIWDKGASVGSSTAWGSWMSASNPQLRDVHEYILIFSKDRYDRELKGESTISRNEFMDYTKSIWKMRTASAKRIGHPAPFPLELPLRLIKLYSYKGDVILDPFMGSGSTAIAAKQLGRYYVGYELCEDYLELSKEKLKQEYLDV